MSTYSKVENLSSRLQRGLVAVLFLATYTLSAVAPFISSPAYAEDVQAVEVQAVETQAVADDTKKVEKEKEKESEPKAEKPVEDLNKLDNQTKPDNDKKPEPKPENPIMPESPLDKATGNDKKVENPIENQDMQEPKLEKDSRVETTPEVKSESVVVREAEDNVKLKDWVCKYVGKPGAYEILKNGNNGLVWVNTNATEDSWFNDKHGLSFVVVADAPRSAKPTTACPDPVDPEAVKVLEPSVEVVCGANNDKATLPVVEHLTYKASKWKNGKLTVTVKADKGFYFEGTDGETKLKLPFVDNNTECDEPEMVVATKPVPEVVCGPNNDTFTFPNVPGVDEYKQTAWVDGKKTVTATAQEGYYFGYDEETEEDRKAAMITTMTWEYVDENTSCGNVLGDTDPTPNVLAAVAPAGALQDTGNDMLLPMLLSMGILGLAILTMTQNSTNRGRKSRLAAFLGRGADKLQLAFAQPFNTI